MLFLENEVQINKNIYAMMLFMSKQVSLPKISSILQKNKNQPKMLYMPFFHESLQLCTDLQMNQPIPIPIKSHTWLR